MSGWNNYTPNTVPNLDILLGLEASIVDCSSRLIFLGWGLLNSVI
jgi:hypothetical protein